MRAVTSASNVFRRALCPGSERMEAQFPEEEESAQSREGQLLHACDADPNRDRSTLKQSQRDLLEIAARLDEQVFERAAEQFGIGPEEPFETGRERELWVHRGIKAELPGHCDLWRYYPQIGLLLIIDKKYGFKQVTPAAANYQLRSYALGGAEEWPRTANVVVAITQPRLSFDERVSMAVYTDADFEPARKELFGILDAARKPGAPLRAGEEQCRYCKAKMICRAYKEQFMIEPVGAAELATCTDEQLSRILVAIQFAGFIKDKAKDEARKRIAAGGMKGWKLGKPTEDRSVADVGKALLSLQAEAGLSRADVLACADLSVNAIEEKIRAAKMARGEKCTWKEARELAESALAHVIERKEKRPSVTRAKEAA